jgi:hypothetical protein
MKKNIITKEFCADCERPIDECICEANTECDCLDCTLDEYVTMIQDVAQCPDCIRKLLLSFMKEVIDHIEFEDIDDED